MSGWFDPNRWWDFIEPKLEQRRVLPLLITIALAGGLVIALATEVGVRYFNTDWHYVAGYSAQPQRSWAPLFALWTVAAAAPFVLGAASTYLLKFYARPRCWLRGITVAVIGTIPVYVAGASLILLPGLLIVMVAFLICCSWWGSGSRRLLGVSDSDSADHVAASLAITGALLVLLSAGIPF